MPYHIRHLGKIVFISDSPNQMMGTLIGKRNEIEFLSLLSFPSGVDFVSWVNEGDVLFIVKMPSDDFWATEDWTDFFESHQSLSHGSAVKKLLILGFADSVHLT